MAVQLEWNGQVGVIVIDRAEKRNAVDLDTLSEILSAQEDASRRGCRVLVVRGAPPAFCSGADLDGAELGEFTDVLGRVLRGFGEWLGLTVAYVDGPALGAGLQIAAACDVRLSTKRSTFGIPAAKLGLAVDSWTVERLTREVGWSSARTMLLTGDAVSASDIPAGFLARSIGSDSVDESLVEAMEIIGEWSKRAPLTIAAHKMAIERASGSDFTLAQVEEARLAAWSSEDAVEGRVAFRERRQPDFRHR
jgi:enoyl-CoA hydratase